MVAENRFVGCGRWTAIVVLALIALVTAVPPAHAQPILRWTADGEASLDYFGKSVAGAGDVNGDGYGDIIVGAFQFSGLAFDQGRAYVYFGGPGADAVPDLVLDGEHALDWFGESVAGAGDVNGDGFDDVVVGARGNDAGGSSAGRAYVFFGGPAPDAVPDVVYTGAAYGDLFGWAVAGAGDVNGDGFDDVLVSAAYNDGAGTDAGRAYLFLGGAAPDAVPDLVLSGQAPTDQFGSSVAGAGDVNGDGFDDIIVGAINNDAGGSNAGRAYLYFGGAVLDPVVDLVLTGGAAGDAFGMAVDGAGDVNGDGFDDVLVGAPDADAPLPGGHIVVDAGRAYLYLGAVAPDAAADVVFTGSVENELLGFAVAGLGDFDGDGHDDVAVGAPEYGLAGSPTGRVFVYGGGPGMDATAEYTFDGAGVGDLYGSAVAGTGDVTGNGRGDLLIGARGFDGPGTNSGRAYLFDTFVPNRPPVCAAAAMSQTELSPANRKLVPLTVTGVTDPDGDPVTITVTAITMDEPLTIGNEATCPDAFIDGGDAVRLRSENDKRGNGRVYVVWFTASDPDGLECEGSASVCVPVHHTGCVDDGQTVDATAACAGVRTDEPGGPLALKPLSITGSRAVVEYAIDAEEDVRLDLYDVGGRRLLTIEQGRVAAGIHSVSWNPAGLSPGVYFYRLQAGLQVATRPVMLLH